MTRNYKATIILDTRGYEAPVETLKEKVTELFKQCGGEVTKFDNLGRKDFVRITDKNHTGDTYFVVSLTGKPELVGNFQETIRLDKQIKRAMVELA